MDCTACDLQTVGCRRSCANTPLRPGNTEWLDALLDSPVWAKALTSIAGQLEEPQHQRVGLSQTEKKVLEFESGVVASAGNERQTSSLNTISRDRNLSIACMLSPDRRSHDANNHSDFDAKGQYMFFSLRAAYSSALNLSIKVLPAPYVSPAAGKKSI